MSSPSRSFRAPSRLGKRLRALAARSSRCRCCCSGRPAPRARPASIRRVRGQPLETRLRVHQELTPGQRTLLGFWVVYTHGASGWSSLEAQLSHLIGHEVSWSKLKEAAERLCRGSDGAGVSTHGWCAGYPRGCRGCGLRASEQRGVRSASPLTRHMGPVVFMVPEQGSHYLYGEGRSGTPFWRKLESHPAIFMVEYALVRSLMAGGLEPDLLLGVSLGELTAAAVAGMLELTS